MRVSARDFAVYNTHCPFICCNTNNILLLIVHDQRLHRKIYTHHFFKLSCFVGFAWHTCCQAKVWEPVIESVYMHNLKLITLKFTACHVNI